MRSFWGQLFYILPFFFIISRFAKTPLLSPEAKRLVCSCRVTMSERGFSFRMFSHGFSVSVPGPRKLFCKRVVDCCHLRIFCLWHVSERLDLASSANSSLSLFHLTFEMCRIEQSVHDQLSKSTTSLGLNHSNYQFCPFKHRPEAEHHINPLTISSHFKARKRRWFKIYKKPLEITIFFFCQNGKSRD